MPGMVNHQVHKTLIRMSPQVREELQWSAANSIELLSMNQVMNRAIHLYATLLRAAKDNGTIVITWPDKMDTTVIL
jgi:hypothetical protein